MFWPALAGMQKLYCIVRLVFCLLTSVCFYLFQHLQKCAAALSSTHQESKGRSWSFLSGSFSCPNRWLVLLSCCSQGLCSCAGLCWLLIDTTHTHTHAFLLASACLSSLVLNTYTRTPFCSSSETPKQLWSGHHCLLLLLPSPQDSFLPQYTFWRCPTAQWRLSPFPFLLLLWAQQIPLIAPTVSYSQQEITPFLHPFTSCPQRTQLDLEHDNSIHMSNRGITALRALSTLNTTTVFPRSSQKSTITRPSGTKVSLLQTA